MLPSIYIPVLLHRRGNPPSMVSSMRSNCPLCQPLPTRGVVVLSPRAQAVPHQNAGTLCLPHVSNGHAMLRAELLIVHRMVGADTNEND
jgi:hypothetical protein